MGAHPAPQGVDTNPPMETSSETDDTRDISQVGCSEVLEMSGCEGLVGLPLSFGMLTALQELSLGGILGGCKGLTGLPASLGALTALQTLKLFWAAA